MPTRRHFAVLSAALLAAACTPGSLWPGRRQRFGLAPVRVEADRVIRTDVGLRPFRRRGFVVTRGALGAKVLVHNYGHGGGGVTLSWGSACLAADLGFTTAAPACAVLGCGAVGLATARVLQERGARVRIYARELPPGTTSNVAGAQWWPASVFDRAMLTPAFERQFQAAARLAFERFRAMTGSRYGVHWTRNLVVSRFPLRDYPAPAGSPLLAFASDVHDLNLEEHPFPAPYVREYRTLMIDTPRYLQAMVEEFRQAGGEIVVRDFADPAELAGLPEATVFNCTGLGAGRLFGDEEMTPVRGQLVVLRPQPEVDYNVLADGGLYMFPRSDGILLGGSHDPGVGSLTPDPAVSASLLAGHRTLFSALRGRG